MKIKRSGSLWVMIFLSTSLRKIFIWSYLYEKKIIDEYNLKDFATLEKKICLDNRVRSKILYQKKNTTINRDCKNINYYPSSYPYTKFSYQINIRPPFLHKTVIRFKINKDNKVEEMEVERYIEFI